jgi:hypothetical protein
LTNLDFFFLVLVFFFLAFFLFLVAIVNLTKETA